MTKELALIPIYQNALLLIVHKSGKCIFPTKDQTTMGLGLQIEEIKKIYFPNMKLELEDYSTVKIIDDSMGSNKTLTVVFKEFSGEKNINPELSLLGETFFIGPENYRKYESSMPDNLKTVINRLHKYGRIPWKVSEPQTRKRRY